MKSYNTLIIICMKDRCVVSLVHDMTDRWCGFLFDRCERLFSMDIFNWDHADCPLSGIKKCPLVGGFFIH